jgi:hypothetical protein
LFIANSSPRARSSTQSSATKFCDVWGRTFVDSDRICGMRRIGFSTATVHPVTKHFSFVSFDHNMLSLLHPPCSPILAPADFFLFLKMKMQLKGCRFHTVAEIQRELQSTTHMWPQIHQYDNSRC